MNCISHNRDLPFLVFEIVTWKLGCPHLLPYFLKHYKWELKTKTTPAPKRQERFFCTARISVRKKIGFAHPASSDTMIYIFLLFSLWLSLRLPGDRFSKDPVTYRARNTILESVISLPWKPALLIFQIWGNCQASKVEACSSWRYKGINGSRKVSGRSRNGPMDGLRSGHQICNFFPNIHALLSQINPRRACIHFLCHTTPNNHEILIITQ